MNPSATETSVADRARLDRAWRRWIAVGLMLGCDQSRIVETLVANGVTPEDAQAELASVEHSPEFEAGHALAQRLLKLESFLEVRQTLGRVSGSSTIDRRAGVTRQEFRDAYYALNRPVVLTDVASSWPALQRWTPQYLGAQLADEPVEIMQDRNSDPRYEVNAMAHRAVVPFSEYVDGVLASSGNDRYLVANNRLLDRPAAQPLWGEFGIDERYLAHHMSEGQVFIWFGPAGTVTPLHHDVQNVLFSQVRGRKRIVLIDPLYSHCLYNEVAVYSEVDPAHPDLARFPRYERVNPVTVVINPGETLFIPVGWWHHVESMDVSISLTFTNFRFPNSFAWRHPHTRRRR